MKIHIEPDFIGGKTNIYIVDDLTDQGGFYAIAKPVQLVFEHRKGVTEKVNPTFTFDDHHFHIFGKAMIAALHKAGFTIPEITEELSKQKDKALQDSATLTATRAHLEDMRKLVFEEPKIEVRGPQ